MNKTDFILFSGGAPGAEAEFGACAERHGIEEVNFTFDGHTEARRRGVRVLNHEELQAGDVSLEYVSRLMHRRYTDSPTDPQGAADALVSGQQRPGDLRHRRRSRTTGPCAAAPAGAPSSPSSVTSRCSSSIRKRTAGSNGPARIGRAGRTAPTITHPHFTGTGTRKVHDNGKRAIEDLFTKSFEQ